MPKSAPWCGACSRTTWRWARNGRSCAPTGQVAAARPRWQAYADLYAAHIEAEEGRAYPAARPLLPAPALRAMGQEMAQRRGVPTPR